MDMRCSNPCVNFSNACTRSCTVRSCLPFCLFLSIFCCYTVQAKRMNCQKVSHQNHVALDSSWHYCWYFVVHADKLASLLDIACLVYVIKSKAIFDHFTICLQMLFKVVFLYCWNKGQKRWNIFYKTYVHFSVCPNCVIILENKILNTSFFIITSISFKTWVLCMTCK